MKRVGLLLFAFVVAFPFSTRAAFGQEAGSGLDLRATLTAQTVASNQLTEQPRSGSPMILGGRSVIYPTWKINEHWFASGAWQLTTRPYYYWDLSTTGYGAKGELLQGSLNYARIAHKGSLFVRVGEMSTAFGSFVLRYDDADNPLVDLPIEYGYYYSPVSIAAVAGAQVDVTRGKWDARAQFANSSPANPRSIFAHDQYGNWAGGAGYTIRQGLRIGVSGYRGPYLDRQFAYFFPGEQNPGKLPANAFGVDGNWTRGHTSVQGEWQKFVLTYSVIPDFRETAGYAEIKQVLGPRWYVAGRYGETRSNPGGRMQRMESAGGFRLNRLQLIKASYELDRYPGGTESNDNTLGIQFVTTLHRSFGRDSDR
ncbi:MAG TPA: hypothetical protein VHZ28_01995 [Terracidiphilus sp.]|jgi:hypothetical protein|nr:hypothetical protein [Terracidiphilus sp.]